MNTGTKIAVAAASAVAASGVAVGVALAATDGIGTKHTSHRTITEQVHRIVVDGRFGDVKVTAERRTGVEVTTKTSWVFSKPKLTASVRDGVLHLESHAKHTYLSAVEYRISAPAGVAVDVDENAADVKVDGAPGNVSVKTDAGDVRVDVKRAPSLIKVETDAGDVHVTVPRGAYRVDTSTDAGDVKVRNLIRYDLAAKSIHAQTDAGDVTVDGR